MRGVRSTVLLAASALTVTWVAAQQVTPEMVMQAYGKNQAALQQYSWQSRTQVSLSGEVKKTTLDQINYDAEGQIQKTPIGDGGGQQKEVRGPIRKDIAESEEDKAAEFATKLKELLGSYTQPANLTNALGRAKVWEGGSASAPEIRIDMTAVIEGTDTVQIMLDAKTHKPARMNINTAMDQVPVTLAVVFQQLDDGTGYPAQATVDTTYSGKPLEISIENFNYVKQGG